MREITLGRGFVAIVDDEDFAALSAFHWYVSIDARRFTTHRYARGRIGVGGVRRETSMHRVILSAPDGVMVDHINGDGLDNRRANLRLATAFENSANARKTSRSTTSRFKGVTWNRNCRKWQVIVRFQKKSRYLGMFASEEEAARVYDAAHAQLSGAFACVNFAPVVKS